MSNARKILALATAAAACTSFVGCGENTKWIAEFNGEKINAGVYLYYELAAYNNVLSYLQTTDKTVTEVTKDDVYYIEDTKETVNAYEWIQSKAMEDLRTFCMVEAEYDRLQLELTEAEEAEVEEMVAYYCDTLGYRENYEDNGISEESLITVYQNNYKYSNLFFAIYGTYEKIGEDGKTTEIEGERYVDDETVWNHYTEHNVRVKVIEFPLFGENSAALTDEEKEEVTLTAEEYLTRAEDGEDFDALIEEYKEATSEEEEEETTEETDETEEEDEYEYETIVSDESTSYSEAVVDKLFELQLDENGEAVELITDTDVNNKIYLVKKYDLREREDLFEEQHDSLLADLVGEEYDDYLADLVANQLTLNVNQDAVDRYVPKKLVLELK
ncbi:MAG: hypothetical protein IJO29_03185 [Oscillospiraceae bacterium]|nr:hypothetical protein [Oscillospiraceae bacterium]